MSTDTETAEAEISLGAAAGTDEGAAEGSDVDRMFSSKKIIYPDQRMSFF